LDPVPADVRDGFDISARCIEKIADLARSRGAPTVVALLPARFQLSDEDFASLQNAMSGTARAFVRDAATERFRTALSSTSVPVLDLLPVFRSEPHPADLYFRQNVHLTARGHQVVAEALLRFLREEQAVLPSSAHGER
jgi:lysophospholipase L1-like esterase